MHLSLVLYQEGPMSHLRRASYRFPCSTAVMTVLVLFGACTQARAVSGIVGECLDDAFGQTTNCTANEITPTALSVVQVVDGCTGPTDTASLVLEATVQSSTLAREDVGFFVGLDGDAAQTGASCWHDYLDPPLTATPAYGDANGNTIPDIHNGPWLTSDSDTCGDIAANTEVIKTLGSVLNPVVVACSDTDSSGSLDLSLCATFDHSQALTCDSAEQAIPVVASKCQCFRFETSVPVPPATTTTTTTTTTLPDSCSPTPLAGCQAGDKAKLVMGRPLPDGTKDKLTWKWAKDADVAAADFGDPLSTANYDLCIYEDGVLGAAAHVPALPDCGATTCWTPRGDSFKYANDASTFDGIKGVGFSAGSDPGNGKILVKGGGSLLGLPHAMLTTPVLVQFVRNDVAGKCWQSMISAPATNDAVKFVGAGD
jgi:hypothetical protein